MHVPNTIFLVICNLDFEELFSLEKVERRNVTSVSKIKMKQLKVIFLYGLQ